MTTPFARAVLICVLLAVLSGAQQAGDACYGKSDFCEGALVCWTAILDSPKCAAQCPRDASVPSNECVHEPEWGGFNEAGERFSDARPSLLATIAGMLDFDYTPPTKTLVFRTGPGSSEEKYTWAGFQATHRASFTARANLVIYDGVAYSTLRDLPIDGDVTACTAGAPPELPDGWYLAPDTADVRTNVVAAHSWSALRIRLASGTLYRTAGQLDDFTTRLVDSAGNPLPVGTSSGWLQMRASASGPWAYVQSDANFNANAANVACRDAGFQSGTYTGRRH